MQAHSFDKEGKLIHICDNKHLPETIEIFLRKSPYFWADQNFKRFFDDIKKLGLDDGGYFERMHRKMSGQLTVEEAKQNGKYEATRLWRVQEWWHQNKYKKVLNKSYNGELFKAAALSKDGHFEEARAVAKKFREDPIMMQVIDHYQQKLCNKFGILKIYEHLPTYKQLSLSEKRDIGSNVYLQNRMNKTLQAKYKKLQAEIAVLTEAELKAAAELLPEDPRFLAPDSDSQSTDQSISTPAPPLRPPPPEQDDPDKDKEQTLKRQYPQPVSKFVQDNRVLLDRETILNDSTFKACNGRVKGAKIYKKNNLYYHRDTFHTGNSAHLEVYNKRGIHIGKANPTTGKIIPNTASKTKKINI